MQEKTLEMRVAELEDRLSKMQFSEEELKAYQKVASLVGPVPALGTAFTCRIVCYCYCHIAKAIGINDCTPGAPGGPVFTAGGGFGTFGT